MIYIQNTWIRLILQMKKATKQVKMEERTSKKTRVSRLIAALLKSSIFCH